MKQMSPSRHHTNRVVHTSLQSDAASRSMQLRLRDHTRVDADADEPFFLLILHL